MNPTEHALGGDLQAQLTIPRAEMPIQLNGDQFTCNLLPQSGNEIVSMKMLCSKYLVNCFPHDPSDFTIGEKVEFENDPLRQKKYTQKRKIPQETLGIDRTEDGNTFIVPTNISTDGIKLHPIQWPKHPFKKTVNNRCFGETRKKKVKNIQTNSAEQQGVNISDGAPTNCLEERNLVVEQQSKKRNRPQREGDIPTQSKQKEESTASLPKPKKQRIDESDEKKNLQKPLNGLKKQTPKKTNNYVTNKCCGGTRKKKVKNIQPRASRSPEQQKVNLVSSLSVEDLKKQKPKKTQQEGEVPTKESTSASPNKRYRPQQEVDVPTEASTSSSSSPNPPKKQKIDEGDSSSPFFFKKNKSLTPQKVQILRESSHDFHEQMEKFSGEEEFREESLKGDHESQVEETRAENEQLERLIAEEDKKLKAKQTRDQEKHEEAMDVEPQNCPRKDRYDVFVGPDHQGSNSNVRLSLRTSASATPTPTPTPAGASPSTITQRPPTPAIPVPVTQTPASPTPTPFGSDVKQAHADDMGANLPTNSGFFFIGPHQEIDQTLFCEELFDSFGLGSLLSSYQVQKKKVVEHHQWKSSSGLLDYSIAMNLNEKNTFKYLINSKPKEMMVIDSVFSPSSVSPKDLFRSPPDAALPYQQLSVPRGQSFSILESPHPIPSPLQPNLKQHGSRGPWSSLDSSNSPRALQESTRHGPRKVLQGPKRAQPAQISALTPRHPALPNQPSLAQPHGVIPAPPRSAFASSAGSLDFDFQRDYLQEFIEECGTSPKPNPEPHPPRPLPKLDDRRRSSHKTTGRHEELDSMGVEIDPPPQVIPRAIQQNDDDEVEVIDTRYELRKRKPSSSLANNKQTNRSKQNEITCLNCGDEIQNEYKQIHKKLCENGLIHDRAAHLRHYSLAQKVFVIEMMEEEEMDIPIIGLVMALPVTELRTWLALSDEIREKLAQKAQKPVKQKKPSSSTSRQVPNRPDEGTNQTPSRQKGLPHAPPAVMAGLPRGLHTRLPQRQPLPTPRNPRWPVLSQSQIQTQFFQSVHRPDVQSWHGGLLGSHWFKAPPGHLPSSIVPTPIPTPPRSTPQKQTPSVREIPTRFEEASSSPLVSASPTTLRTQNLQSIMIDMMADNESESHRLPPSPEPEPQQKAQNQNCEAPACSLPLTGVRTGPLMAISLRRKPTPRKQQQRKSPGLKAADDDGPMITAVHEELESQREPKPESEAASTISSPEEIPKQASRH